MSCRNHSSPVEFPLGGPRALADMDQAHQIELPTSALRLLVIAFGRSKTVLFPAPFKKVST